jgi:hypothetical protein
MSAGREERRGGAVDVDEDRVDQLSDHGVPREREQPLRPHSDDDDDDENENEVGRDDDDEGGESDDDEGFSDEEDDDEEQEDEHQSIFLELEVCAATQRLIDSQREGLDQNLRLVVDVGRVSEEAIAGQILTDPTLRHQFWISRFVQALSSHRQIPILHIEKGNFQRDGAHQTDNDYVDRFMNGEMEHDNDSVAASQHEDVNLVRLFTSVLPTHPTLVDITLSKSRIHPRYLQLYCESISSTSTSLRRLTLDLTPINRECSQFIKSMLQRNARIEQLSILHCCLDLDCWRLVCEGVAENSHIQQLHLMGDLTVEPDTLAAAIGPRSRLTRLIVDGKWSVEAFAKFIDVMRTNTVLEHLFLCQEYTFPRMHQFEDMLHTYNFSIPSVHLHPLDGTPHKARIEALLERNDSVRDFHGHLQARKYHVDNRLLWPTALQQVTTFPTLVYRFVRCGNTDAFTDHVASLHTNSSAKKRQLC